MRHASFRPSRPGSIDSRSKDGIASLTYWACLATQCLPKRDRLIESGNDGTWKCRLSLGCFGISVSAFSLNLSRY